MLMTANRPQAQNVTDIGLRLLRAIRQADGGAIDRTALAAAIGKHRLNKWHIAQLDLLAERGEIRIETRPSARPHILEYVYIADGQDG